jgi:hypothetical protein
MFEYNGIKVKLHNFVVVDYAANLQLVDEYCEISPGELKEEGIWKISLLPSQETDDLASWLRLISLSTLLVDTTSVWASFADLPGASLAQTTGSQITLDTTAAGHGWFIDYTPYLNEEWLPTSNPYEWQPKLGSEAEGKMDMLSVFVHESWDWNIVKTPTTSWRLRLPSPSGRRVGDEGAWLLRTRDAREGRRVPFPLCPLQMRSP